MVFIKFISQFFLNSNIDISKIIRTIIKYTLIIVLILLAFFYIKNLKSELKNLNKEIENKTEIINSRENTIREQELEIKKDKESKIIDNKIIINKIKKDKEIDESVKENINSVSEEIKNIKESTEIKDFEKNNKVNEVLINKIYESYCNSVGIDINECNG